MRLAAVSIFLSAVVSGCATTAFAPAAALTARAGDAGTALSGPGMRASAMPGRIQEREKKKEPWINIISFASGRELDEVTFENEDTDVETDASDVESSRVGAGVAFGRRSVRGYVHGFFERLEGEFDDTMAVELDARGIGFGGGVMGEPWIATFDDTTHLILPYRLDLGLVLANDDDLEIDLLYYDARLEGGLGVDWNGLQPSAGFRVDTLLGVLEAEDSINDSIDATFAGINAGFYAGVKYQHPDFPLWFDVRASGGDVDSIAGTLGCSL
jgi:hypothetical protein